MIRRRQEEVPENHERWVISYADFITLLFAFFVVMYSISSVNEGKYKVLSDSLVNVFNAKAKTLDPVQMGTQEAKNPSERLVSLPFPGDFPSAEDYKYSVEGLFDDVEQTSNSNQGDRGEVSHLTRLSDQISIAFQSLIAEGLANVTSNRDWIEIDIQSSVLFESGSAYPSEQARQIVKKVSSILSGYKNPIHVEGFTDNVPIQTAIYPSNWELSAARAAAVVRLLEVSEIEPDRLAAVGYGEHRPVADNETDEGRARNRRVALIISKLDKDKPREEPVNNGPDYKLGAGQPATAVSDARDPQQRQSATRNVPLKIMKLEQGGMLFSSDPQGATDSRQPDSPQSESQREQASQQEQVPEEAQ